MHESFKTSTSSQALSLNVLNCLDEEVDKNVDDEEVDKNDKVFHQGFLQ